VVQFSRIVCDGLSVLALGLSLKPIHNEAPEPEELGDRANPDNSTIRKDAGYDKGVSNCSGDCVGGDHANDAMLHRLVRGCNRHCIREKAEHKITLTIS